MPASGNRLRDAEVRIAGLEIVRKPFEYAIVWVVPRVERGERFNAGIVVHSRPHRFLGARTHLDVALLHALAPDCDEDAIRQDLDAIVRPDGGVLFDALTVDEDVDVAAQGAALVEDEALERAVRTL